MTTLLDFNQRITARRRPPGDHEIVVDSFAGAGGWGRGEEAGTGWAVDVAINHDPLAIETHKANHPATIHYTSDVFEIDPRSVEPGRLIAHCHFSPDCTHHSKARGAAPVSDRVRGLAWIVLAWAYLRRPRVITLENVEEFRDWGPTENGRAIKVPGMIGRTFDAFIKALSTGLSKDHPDMPQIRACLGNFVPLPIPEQGLGYKVEYRELRACDYGAPTIRKRFFLIARCDGDPIVWPEPTHGPAGSGRLPYRTAAECIDFSRPCPSIFLTPAEAKEWGRLHNCPPPKRPLAENTLKRVANGFDKYVLKSAKPFIVSANHGDSGGSREYSIDAPMRTITAARRGEALVTPYITPIQHYGNNHHGLPADEPLRTITAFPKGGAFALTTPFLTPRYGEREGQEPRARSVDAPLPSIVPDGNGAQLIAPLLVGAGGPVYQGKPASVDRPINTILRENRAAMVAAFLTRHFGGMNARDLRLPMPTATCRATQNQLTTVHMAKLRGTCADGQPIDEPAPTLTSGGNHAALVATFLQTYYSEGSGKTGTAIDQPAPTVTTRDRLSLVTVTLFGIPWVVYDIGLRMLQPDELLRCQFGELADGWVLLGNKTQQTAGIGNSVCPHVARAIVKANVRIRRVKREEVA